MRIKALRDFLREKLSFHMTDEQEPGYISSRAKYILKYEKFALLFIIASQIYNIAYAFVYTKGKLHTTASRVYTVLYVILLFVSLVCLLLTFRFRKRFPENPKVIIRLQILLGVFLLLWGACITIYDQRVSENISVYMIISLIVALLVDFNPVQTVAVYGTMQALLIWLLPLFKDPGKDSYGVNLNLILVMLMCIIISIYRYYYTRKHYRYQQIIVERNVELKRIAYLDTLTGLKNRRYLDDEMNTLYQQCFNKKTPLTFMMLDIDDFKSYNDQYGHLQGDKCLRRVTWRIYNTLEKEHEYLIRYGGEEFLYIGMGIDEQTAESKAQYFNKIIRELVIGPSDQEAMGITISIGVYTVRWDETAQCPAAAWEDCVGEADRALYMAKNSGKDKYVCLAGKQ